MKLTKIRSLIRRTISRLHEKLLDSVSFLRMVSLSTFADASQSNARRVLVIDEMLPNPRFGAGYPRAAAILQVMIDAGWQVTMYPMISSTDQYHEIQEMFGPEAKFLKSFGESGLRRFMQEHIGSFDTVLVSRPNTMQAYKRQLTAAPSFSNGTRCIYDAEAIFSVRDRDRRFLFETPMTDGEFQDALDKEVAITLGSNAIITVTNNEAELYRKRVDVPVHVVSHKMLPRVETPGFGNRHNFLFVGRSVGPREHSPNVDSLIWFVEEIMPVIDRQIGDNYKLHVVGMADQDLIGRLQSNRVIFNGVVNDLNAIYDACRVFVAPTRFAAGLPIKVTEAAGMGIPCVTTGVLAKQMQFKHDFELLAGDTCEQFGAACARLYSDEIAWEALRSNALNRVMTDYSPLHFARSVMTALAPDDRAISAKP